MERKKKELSPTGWPGRILLILITGVVTFLVTSFASPLIVLQTDGGAILMSRGDVRELYDERDRLQEEREYYRAQYIFVNTQLDELRLNYELSQDELNVLNDGRVSQARLHMETGNYRAAIQLLDGIPSTSPEITILLQEATLMYELQTIEQVNDLLLNRQIDDAANLAREAQRILPNSRYLRELLDDVEARAERSGPLNTVAPLFDMVGRGQQVQHENSVTMGGETFRDVLVLGRFGAGHTFTPASLHNLGRQYSELSGYVGRVDGTSLRHATINFFGDGELLHYIEFNATDMPVPFSVNIEGVLQLRIELVIGGGSSDSTPLYAIQGFLN